MLDELVQQYCDQDKHDEEERLCRRTLEACDEAPNPVHPQIVAMLHRLARCCYSRGKLDEAELVYQHIMTICERPSRHFLRFNSVTPLNGLASVYRGQGRLDEAESACRRALAICEASPSPNPLHLADSLADLANVCRDQAKHEEAEPLFQRALDILEEEDRIGPDHLRVGEVLTDMAAMHASQGKRDQAVEACQRAIAIFERSASVSHPSCVRAREILADITGREQ